MSDENVKRRIMLAAGPIFASKGFRSATVREICDAADVNVASINYHFGDKQNLYQQTVVLAREMRVQQVPYPEWKSETKPEEKLHDFIALLLNRLVAMQSEPWQVRLLMREVLQPTEACEQLVRDYFSPFFHTMLGIVDELVGFRLDDATRFKIGFSVIGQCLHYRFASDVTSFLISDELLKQQFDLDSLADHITRFTIAAIRSYAKQPGDNPSVIRQQ